MHFLPRQLKRHSFSWGVSNKEPTFVCRRCGGGTLMVAGYFRRMRRLEIAIRDPKRYINNPSVIRGLRPTPSRRRLGSSRDDRAAAKTRVPLGRRVRRRARFSFKPGQSISERTKTENCTNFPGKSNPPESPEPVPSNMAALERVYYQGTGSTPFMAASQLIQTHPNSS